MCPPDFLFLNKNEKRTCISKFLVFHGRGDRIRTCGLLVPNQARYQTALRPVTTFTLYKIALCLSNKFLVFVRFYLVLLRVPKVGVTVKSTSKILSQGKLSSSSMEDK